MMEVLSNVEIAVGPQVTRFAPSPTGPLHLGHGYAALFAWAAAADSGGQFLLRIEDIDTGRCRPEFEAGILRDVAWLGSDIGLTWQTPVRRQSEHLGDYRAALRRLSQMSLLYPCFCTRREIMAEIEAAGGAPHGPDGPLYPGLCRRLSQDERESRIAQGEPHALRLDSQAARARAGPLTWIEDGDGPERGEIAATPEILGDAVLARKDVATSYHLAVTLDDAAQQITLVTRGDDLKHATHLHRLLQALLDLPVPRWRHHRVLSDESGQRLAKRHESLTLAALRLAGHTPSQVRAMAGFED